MKYEAYGEAESRGQPQDEAKKCRPDVAHDQHRLAARREINDASARAGALGKQEGMEGRNAD
jgi:hypothetical protein